MRIAASLRRSGILPNQQPASDGSFQAPGLQ
jgi:hypothetical protein